MSRPFIITAAITTIILLSILGLYLSVLLTPNPLRNPVAQWLPWPVVCSTKGCFTTQHWHQYRQIQAAFASTVEQQPLSDAAVLTTLTRQHLAHHGEIRSPVTVADARRYREEVLNMTSEERVKNVTSLSLTTYDRTVLVPFLEQENLRQQKNIESTDELYQQLAANRWVVALPLSLKWNSETATIETTPLYPAT